MKHTFAFSRRQHGAALVVSLLLLAVMTILALSASQTTRLQERMAGNARDMDVAFQAGEAGVRNAEAWIDGQAAQPQTCSAAPCTVFQAGIFPPDMATATDTWWTTNGQPYGTAAKEMSSANADPIFVVEEAAFLKDDLTEGNGPPSGRVFYRTYAGAQGATDSARVVVQTTFTKRF